MGEKQEMPNTGYVVIRCDDEVIVARLRSFPVCERALMYRRGEDILFMPVQKDEIIGTKELFYQLLGRGIELKSKEIK